MELTKEEQAEILAAFQKFHEEVIILAGKYQRGAEINFYNSLIANYVALFRHAFGDNAPVAICQILQICLRIKADEKGETTFVDGMQIGNWSDKK